MTAPDREAWARRGYEAHREAMRIAMIELPPWDALRPDQREAWCETADELEGEE